MIEPKEDGEQQGKRNGQKDVLDLNVPEMDEPGAVPGGHKGRARRQILDLDARHAANVHKARKEDDRQRRAIVLDKRAHIVVEQGAAAQLVAKVGDRKHEDRDQHAQVKRLVVAQQDEDLDALLQVDKGDIKAKNVAGEPRHVAQPVARVGHGQEPVHDHGPEADPGHEGEVVDAGGGHDVVDGVVEDSDGSRHADNDERLAGEHAEDDGAEHGREEGLVDAVVGVGAGEHVEREGEGGQDVGKVHVHGGGHDAVVDGVAPVTPVVGRASSYVVDHAAKETDLPPLGRPRCCCCGCCCCC